MEEEKIVLEISRDEAELIGALLNNAFAVSTLPLAALYQKRTAIEVDIMLFKLRNRFLDLREEIT